MATLESQDNVKLHGNQSVAGVKTFTDSPIVPTPSSPTDAANKDYVDTALPSYINGTAVLSFPAAYEDSFAITTVLNSTITNALVKSVSFIPLVSDNHDSLDDFQWDGLTFNIENIVDGVSFDIRATASNNTWGNYNVKYLIQI